MKKGWEVKKLGEVLKIQNGYAFDAKLFTIEKGMPLIRIRDIKDGLGTVTNFNGKYDKKYEVNAGDFLIGMDGEFGCYEWKGETALLNQRVCRLQEFSNKLYPRYLFYGINKYLKAIEDVTAFATVKHISSKQIENIEIPLPPLQEQKQIVTILDSAFSAIAKAKANAEQNLKNAKELFESYLQGVFENKGDGWEEKTVGEICTFKGGGTPSTKVKRYWEGNIPWVSPKDMKSKLIFDSQDHISLEAIEKSSASIIPSGSILIVVRSGILVRIVPLGITTKDLAINQDLKALCPNKNVDLHFLFYFLEGNMRLMLSKVTRGATVHRLTTDSLRELSIGVPSITIQQTIVQKLDALLTETKRLESIYQQKIADLEELKKSLLQKAFNGELKTESACA